MIFYNIKKYMGKIIKFCFRNIVRLLFFAAVAFMILMTAAWFAAVKYFNAELLAGSLADTLQKSLGRPVLIESFKLTSLNTLEIKNLKIVDTTAQDYKDLLSVRSVLLKCDLPALLKKQIIIREIILDKPVISIVKAADGSLNIPSIKTNSSQSAEGQRFEFISQSGRETQILVQDWTMQDGRISFRDADKDVLRFLNSLSVHFYNLKFNALSNFTAQFLLTNRTKDKIIESDVLIHGAFNPAGFNPALMQLKNTEFEFGGFKSPLTAVADIEDFTAPSVKLDILLPPFTPKDWGFLISNPTSLNLPETEINIKAKIQKGFKSADIESLRATTKDIAVNANGQLTFENGIGAKAVFFTDDFNVQNADYFGILKPYSVTGRIKAEGSLTFENNKISFPSFSAVSNDLSWKISNFIIENTDAVFKAKDNFDYMTADISDGIFNVGRQKVSKITGTTTLEYSKQNFYAILKDAQFNDRKIRMSVSISKVRQAALRKIRALIYLDLFNPVEIFHTTEDFVDALTKNKTSYTPEEGSLAWLHAFKKGLPSFMPNFSGFVYADKFESPIISGQKFNAEFNLEGLLPSMAELSGTIVARLEDGIIYKLQEAAEKQKALGVAFQPFVIMSKMERAGSFKMGQILKDTPFEIMTVSAAFNKGKMDINNFYVDGNVIAATVDGKVNWDKENLDLDIVTMFKNTSKRGALSENLTDESGEPALAFGAKGAMINPSIEMKSPKKTGAKIAAARQKGVRTDFSAGQDFIKDMQGR